MHEKPSHMVKYFFKYCYGYYICLITHRQQFRTNDLILMTILLSNSPKIYLLNTTLLLLQSSPAKLKVKYVYIERRYLQVVSDKGRFWILIGIVLISGFSQGMLLPT